MYKAVNKRDCILQQDRGDAVMYNCEKRLQLAVTPKFLQIFQAIAKLPEGVKFVVDMRADILVRNINNFFNAVIVNLMFYGRLKSVCNVVNVFMKWMIICYELFP